MFERSLHLFILFLHQENVKCGLGDTVTTARAASLNHSFSDVLPDGLGVAFAVCRRLFDGVGLAHFTSRITSNTLNGAFSISRASFLTAKYRLMRGSSSKYRSRSI